MANIFISHRHDDAELASVVKGALLRLSIPQSSIFMSSDAKTGVKPGSKIDEKIWKRIRNTDLFLFIYTLPEENWSYCTYELGLVIGKDTKETNVVVLSLCGHSPKMLSGKKHIDLRSDTAIREFVRLLHADGKFLIPDKKTKNKSNLLKILMKTDQTVMDSRADNLIKELKRFLPSQKTKTTNRLKSLTLSVPGSCCMKIRDKKYNEKTLKIVKSEVLLTESSDIQTLNMFGISEHTEGAKLATLLSKWKKARAKVSGRKVRKSEERWVADFVKDIIAAVSASTPTPSDNWFRGAEKDNKNFYFQPLIARSHRNRDGSVDLDVYIYKYKKVKRHKKKQIATAKSDTISKKTEAQQKVKTS